MNLLSEFEQNQLLQENLKYQADNKNLKTRLDSKEKEILDLRQKIIEQDANYAIAARKQEG